MHLAAEIGCRSIVELFLDEPTREYGRDNHGRALLHYLAMWQPGWLIEEFILAKSPIIDVPDKKRRTPLTYAALYNNNSVVSTLARRGAKINNKDSNGSTPRHHALEGSAETAFLLISLEARLMTLDGLHQTCLQLAIRSQRSDIIDLVLSYMYENNQSSNNENWRIDSQQALRMLQNRDFHGRTALHRMCAAHDFTRRYTSKLAVYNHVRRLIQYGADVDAQDKFGYTPAHLAAIGNNMAAMDSLLDFQPKLTILDQHHCTAMDWALAQGQVQLTEMMREVGGLQTKDYAEKLGAFQQKQIDKTEKQYDMTDWSLVPISMDYRTGRRTIDAWGDN